MGYALPWITFTIAIVAIIANQANPASSELQNGQDEDNWDLSPKSFADRQLERKKRQTRSRGRGGPKVRPRFQAGHTLMTFSLPHCEEDGTMFFQGYDNYFVKCVANPVHGGFYRVLYTCPKDVRSIDDSARCIPADDCAECGGIGMGGDLPGMLN